MQAWIDDPEGYRAARDQARAANVVSINFADGTARFTSETALTTAASAEVLLA